MVVEIINVIVDNGVVVVVVGMNGIIYCFMNGMVWVV